MEKTMPIGIDNFKKIREQCYFVDKTLFIKDLIDSHGEVTLITRPRRFGKTLTMSMLDYFFNIAHAAESDKLFAGLAIETAGEAYMRHRGKYPVIFLSLRTAKQLTMENMLLRLGQIMSTLYQKYMYLLESDTLNTIDKAYFHKVLLEKCLPTELENSLERLTSYLYQYHGIKPILLLDEYDVPVQMGWERGFYDSIIVLMKNFMGAALKSNDALQFAIITGVLRVSKESIFSDLNNLDVCSVMTEKHSDVFGFTPQEVETIARDLAIMEKLPEIKRWYDGYRFGASDIYNPWSVIKYIDAKCKPQAYWINTSSNGIVRTLLKTATHKRMQELRSLLQDETVSTTIDEGVIYSDIGQKDEAIYAMLLTTGYLKITGEERLSEIATIYKLAIPNLEIKSLYAREILENMADGLNVNSLQGMMLQLLRGNAAVFEEELQEILLKMVSFYDTKSREGFYHGLLLGMTGLLLGAYDVASNRESGYGRFDLAIFPNQPERTGVVMEFKVADTEDALEEKAAAALAQITAKAYTTEFEKRGVQRVWRYGIAFCGKKVKILRADED